MRVVCWRISSVLSLVSVSSGVLVVECSLLGVRWVVPSSHLLVNFSGYFFNVYNFFVKSLIFGIFNEIKFEGSILVGKEDRVV